MEFAPGPNGFGTKKKQPWELDTQDVISKITGDAQRAQGMPSFSDPPGQQAMPQGPLISKPGAFATGAKRVGGALAQGLIDPNYEPRGTGHGLISSTINRGIDPDTGRNIGDDNTLADLVGNTASNLNIPAAIKAGAEAIYGAGQGIGTGQASGQMRPEQSDEPAQIGNFQIPGSRQPDYFDEGSYARADNARMNQQMGMFGAVGAAATLPGLTASMPTGKGFSPAPSPAGFDSPTPRNAPLPETTGLQDEWRHWVGPNGTQRMPGTWKTTSRTAMEAGPEYSGAFRGDMAFDNIGQDPVPNATGLDGAALYSKGDVFLTTAAVNAAERLNALKRSMRTATPEQRPGIIAEIQQLQSQVGREAPKDVTPFYGQDLPREQQLIGDPQSLAQQYGLQTGLLDAPTQEGFFNPGVHALLTHGAPLEGTLDGYGQFLRSRGVHVPDEIWGKAASLVDPGSVISRDDMVANLDAATPRLDRRQFVNEDHPAIQRFRDEDHYSGEDPVDWKHAQRFGYQGEAQWGDYRMQAEPKVDRGGVVKGGDRIEETALGYRPPSGQLSDVRPFADDTHMPHPNLEGWTRTTDIAVPADLTPDQARIMDTRQQYTKEANALTRRIQDDHRAGREAYNGDGPYERSPAAMETNQRHLAERQAIQERTLDTLAPEERAFQRPDEPWRLIDEVQDQRQRMVDKAGAKKGTPEEIAAAERAANEVFNERKEAVQALRSAMIDRLERDLLQDNPGMGQLARQQAEQLYRFDEPHSLIADAKTGNDPLLHQLADALTKATERSANARAGYNAVNSGVNTSPFSTGKSDATRLLARDLVGRSAKDGIKRFAWPDGNYVIDDIGLGNSDQRKGMTAYYGNDGKDPGMLGGVLKSIVKELGGRGQIEPRQFKANTSAGQHEFNTLPLDDKAATNAKRGMRLYAQGGDEKAGAVAASLANASSKSGVERPGWRVAQENRHDLEPDLRVRVPKPDIAYNAKGKPEPYFTQKTNNKNAGRQIENLDKLATEYPDPLKDALTFSRMMSRAVGDEEVPVPPYAAIRDNNPDAIAAKLRKLTQGQIDDADHGFENAREMRRMYRNGEMQPSDTGKLFAWSFLSRGVSPYTQESLFLDAFHGLTPWIERAAREPLDASLFEKGGEYDRWVKGVAPKGSGQPGAGATHNLMAFGKNFLQRMSQTMEGTNKSRLQHLHDMIAGGEMTGQQIRREFLRMSEGVGIDNKVVSFSLLVAGFDDVMVLDRVQMKHLWDDGRFGDKNLYDGRKEKRPKLDEDGNPELDEDGNPATANVSVTGTALSKITYGARGLAIYEAIERSLLSNIQEAYKQVGREDAASLGRYHWESWVTASGQEASHGTLGAVMRGAKRDNDPTGGLTAKQGEYGTYQYGARYGRDTEGGPYFLYDTSDGETFRFASDRFTRMIEQIKAPKSGVIPKGFKVSEATDAPWFKQPGVNRQKLDEIVRQFGGNEALPDGPAADRPAQGEAAPRARRRASSVKAGAERGDTAAIIGSIVNSSNNERRRRYGP